MVGTHIPGRGNNMDQGPKVEGLVWPGPVGSGSYRRSGEVFFIPVSYCMGRREIARSYLCLPRSLSLSLPGPQLSGVPGLWGQSQPTLGAEF